MLRLALPNAPRLTPMGLYVRPNWFMRHPWVSLVTFAAVMLGYGLMFAFYGGADNPAPFALPAALLTLMAFWLLPELRNPPLAWINRLLLSFMVAVAMWPDYMALILPGMPWITAIRLIGVPLLLSLLLCAFGAAAFRARMRAILMADPVITFGVVAFAGIAVLSIGLSSALSYSVSRLIVACLAWFAIFFAAACYFAQSGKARVFSHVMLIAVIFATLVALYEARYQALPWKDRIPSFLAVQDEAVLRILEGSARAHGTYRVQAKFSTPIGLGEFFGLALPFLLHLFATTRYKLLRLLIAALIPAMGYVVIRADSRLAFIAFISSLVLYILFAAYQIWRTRKDSLFAPAILLAYPAFLTVFALLSLFWRRLYVMIWGGGAQSFSTQGREDQIDRGLDLIASNPFGYGIGQGAQVLNYIAPGYDMPTIDSYFLSVGLEFGVLGFIIYYGVFLWATGRAALTSLSTQDPDILFMGPAAIALLNFLISKAIYSQQENHPLAFALLGMVVALYWRHRQGRQPAR